MPQPASDINPFVYYRQRLDSYRRAIDSGLSDEWFVDAVSRLDERVADIDGTGFRVTPLVDGSALATAAGLNSGADDGAKTLLVKAEIHNVAGSHKARHLFGSALHLLVDQAVEPDMPKRSLAIASCGNAALAAGVVARALDLEIAVFVPTWANETIVEKLQSVGSSIKRCERQQNESGDPCYLRFGEYVGAGGAIPFSVQGTDTPTTFDGGRTIGWEMFDQATGLRVEVSRLYIQVGGGALAVSAFLGFTGRDIESLSAGLGPGTQLQRAVTLMPVQAAGCAPLERAWRLLGETSPPFDFMDAAKRPTDFMWPWDNPASAADGILDDITYDWLPLLQATRLSGGAPVVACEDIVVKARDLAQKEGFAASATGTAGIAGVLTDRPDSGISVVILSGVERH